MIDDDELTRRLDALRAPGTRPSLAAEEVRRRGTRRRRTRRTAMALGVVSLVAGTGIGTASLLQHRPGPDVMVTPTISVLTPTTTTTSPSPTGSREPSATRVPSLAPTTAPATVAVPTDDPSSPSLEPTATPTPTASSPTRPPSASTSASTDVVTADPTASDTATDPAPSTSQVAAPEPLPRYAGALGGPHVLDIGDVPWPGRVQGINTWSAADDPRACGTPQPTVPVVHLAYDPTGRAAPYGDYIPFSLTVEMWRTTGAAQQEALIQQYVTATTTCAQNGTKGDDPIGVEVAGADAAREWTMNASNAGATGTEPSRTTFYAVQTAAGVAVVTARADGSLISRLTDAEALLPAVVRRLGGERGAGGAASGATAANVLAAHDLPAFLRPTSLIRAQDGPQDAAFPCVASPESVEWWSVSSPTDGSSTFIQALAPATSEAAAGESAAGIVTRMRSCLAKQSGLSEAATTVDGADVTVLRARVASPGQTPAPYAVAVIHDGGRTSTVEILSAGLATTSDGQLLDLARSAVARMRG